MVMKQTVIQPMLEEKIEQASEGLRAIAHKVRLSILCYLSQEPMCVNDLVRLTKTSQSNVSQHLSKMRMMGILDYEKRGQQVFYRIAQPEFIGLIAALQNIYCPEMCDSEGGVK